MQWSAHSFSPSPCGQAKLIFLPHRSRLLTSCVIILYNTTSSENRSTQEGTMNFKPLHDWTVIRPADAATISRGGLYIPDSAKEKPQEGTIEAVGPGAYEEEKDRKTKDEKKERRFIPTTVKPGDRVLYEKYAGQTRTLGNEERVLVRERDILGILPEGASSRPVPLQIPARTTVAHSTALVKAPTAAQRALVKVAAPAAVKKAAKKKSAKKNVAKKAAKKPVVKKAAKSASAPKKKITAGTKKKSVKRGTAKKKK
jgi:chaperonin GroES